MPFNRRSLLSAGLGVGFGAGLSSIAAAAGPRSEREAARLAATEVPSAGELGLKPGSTQDQTATLQAAIDEAANRGAPLLLPSGRFRTGRLQLRPGTRLIGTARTTTLEFVGGQAFLTGEGDGTFAAFDSRTGERLWQFICGAGVNAPPVTYELDGVQYIVVAAGGSSIFGYRQGDAVLAFALMH